MHSCAVDNLSCLSNRVFSPVRSQSRALLPMFSTAPKASLSSMESDIANRANLSEEEPEFKHRMLRCDIGSPPPLTRANPTRVSGTPVIGLSGHRVIGKTGRACALMRQHTRPKAKGQKLRANVPFPIPHFRHVLAVFADVLVVLIELPAEELNGLVAFFFHSRDA